MAENEDALPGEESAAPTGDGPYRSEGRLNDLLRASTSVVERLDLEVVLRRIVEAGMTLVGARYGALGVISREGGLERFIHVGIDRTTADAIGHLPTGRGVLGAVIADREPIRLEHLSDDPRSAGFPQHHPSMDSFLGVPVRVGDQVYGNLYLTEGDHGPFTVDDQELIVALAATAGIAIENARLYDVAKTREAWNATIADVMSAMLDVSGENVLDVIAERVAALIDAELVAVATPHGEDQLELSTVYGPGAEVLRGRTYPAAGTLTARALASRQAVSIDGQPAAAMFDWQPGLGPTVAIPLFAGDEPLGVLTVSRQSEGPTFTTADLEMAFAFAAHASIALEIVRAREDRRRLETTRDRARIARDLHDHVIQRLFGAGLALQGVSSLLDADSSAAIETQIDVIDATIKDIRTIVFALSTGERPGVKRLRDRLLDVAADVADSWPTPPRLSFAGALDSLISPGLADDLVAVLRELLTNIVKHARADTVEVAVSMADDVVELIVEDDGVGVSGSARRSGLANISARALLRGGGSEVTSRPGGGTRVRWHAPIDHVQGADQ
ncbi:GAF domain-containing protein [Microbacterium sp.]|uniref:sensor histidine kinase n=1 Tax=Microbacterium sp. TaxID=51671 RepID=UPI002E311A88|nr:GAF domain-containing protein [Microbacterium sp.]HEX5728775.1 GAF domain-containing protein [Microbacterium sp.]